jgi:hypothetical protein
MTDRVNQLVQQIQPAVDIADDLEPGIDLHAC